MGIPKLSNDLQQFCGPATLGTPGCKIDARSIQSLVIDGPSLVYYVFNRIIAIKSSRVSGVLESLPTYSEISRGITHLLSDLEDHGVEIKRIYFDGGLPVEKRATRLERLEKLRLQLVSCQKQWPNGFIRHRKVQLESLDYETALWKSHSPDRKIQSLLPPPFMVGNAIEELKHSRWAGLVVLVPGEADPFCADEARRSKCAVLSNDSDMVVYNLGQEGCVVQLQSLQKLSAAANGKETRVHASCICLPQLYKTLKLTDLKRVAFERSTDASVSFATILQRVRDSSRGPMLVGQYQSFIHQYESISTDTSTDRGFSGHGVNLDPRVSELAVQVLTNRGSGSEDDKWNMYLPFLFEDPSRDAAWSYGARLRETAYSILACNAASVPEPYQVHEFYRRGNHIGEVAVSLNDRGSLDRSMAELCKSLSLDAGVLSNAFPQSLRWRAFAIGEVQKQKAWNGKALLSDSQLRWQLGVSIGKRERTWEDIHVTACVEAVLYSTMALKQTIQLVLTMNEQCQKSLLELDVLLRNLPRIAELIVDPDEFKVQNASDLQSVMDHFLKCGLIDDNQDGPGVQHNDMLRGSNDVSSLTGNQQLRARPNVTSEPASTARLATSGSSDVRRQRKPRRPAKKHLGGNIFEALEADML